MLVPLELDARGLEHAAGGLDQLRPGPIAGDQGHFVCHVVLSSVTSSGPQASDRACATMAACSARAVRSSSRGSSASASGSTRPGSSCCSSSSTSSRGRSRRSSPRRTRSAFAVAVVAAVLFFGSILLHELGHALAARREGIEVSGIELFLFGGVMKMSRDTDSPGAEFRVAAAGPARDAADRRRRRAADDRCSWGPDRLFDAGAPERRPDRGHPDRAAVRARRLQPAAARLQPRSPPSRSTAAGSRARWRGGSPATAARRRASRPASARASRSCWSATALYRCSAATPGGCGTVMLGWLLGLRGAHGDPPERLHRPARGHHGRRPDGRRAGDDPRRPAGRRAPTRTSSCATRAGSGSRSSTPTAASPASPTASRCARSPRRGDHRPVGELVVPPGEDGQVRADTPLEALLASEPLRRFGALMAVDGDGRLRGVVTLEQVSRALQAHAAPAERLTTRSSSRPGSWWALRTWGAMGFRPDGPAGSDCSRRRSDRRREVACPCSSGWPPGWPRRSRLVVARRQRPAPTATHAQPPRAAPPAEHRSAEPDAEAGRTTYRLARHARTRRPHHRRRTGRPARRARRRGRRVDRGHHEQGPPRPLPLQRGRGRHQRRAEPRRLVGVARLRHRQGLRLPRRPGRDRDHVPRGARRGAVARAPGRHLPPQPRGQARHARVRRRLGRPHLLRGRHHRPGAAARALRAADEAPRDGRPLRGVVRHRARAGRRRASAAARSRATSATARCSCSPPSP